MAMILVNIDIDTGPNEATVLQEIQALERIARAASILPRLAKFLNPSAINWVADRMRHGLSPDIHGALTASTQIKAISQETIEAREQAKALADLVDAQRRQATDMRLRMDAMQQHVRNVEAAALKQADTERRCDEAIALAGFFQMQAHDLEARMSRAYEAIAASTAIPKIIKRDLGSMLVSDPLPIDYPGQPPDFGSKAVSESINAWEPSPFKITSNTPTDPPRP